MRRVIIAGACCVAMFTTLSRADILNWYTGTVIDGTKDITPGPEVNLSNWATSSHNLRYALLDDVDLTGSNMSESWLDSADFAGSTLTGANFMDAVLSSANLSGANLTNARLNVARMTSANLTGANLTGAICTGATLTNTDFTGAYLTNANFERATFAGARFTDAYINGADLYNASSAGFTVDQLRSTASYKNKDLSGVNMGGNSLGGIDLKNQNLTGASFEYSYIAGADLTGANLTRARMDGAYLYNASLAGAVFTDAVISGASFWGATSKGFVKEQLYSTASYKSKDLHAIDLEGNNLTGWDFHGQNLTGAGIPNSNLTGANFSGATLTNINLCSTNMASANLEGAKAAGASLYLANMTNANLTRANLAGAWMQQATLSGANLTGACLTGTDLTSANISGADFTLADVRGTNQTGIVGAAVRRNTISKTGRIWATSTAPGLNLIAGDQLVIRNYDMPIGIDTSWGMQNGAVMKMVLESNWKSIINADVTPDLGGTLNLAFAEGIDPASLIGTDFKLFNWNGRLVAGDRFDMIAADSWATWDTSRLYTDGIVTLTAVPEPITMALLAAGGFVVRRRR